MPGSAQQASAPSRESAAGRERATQHRSSTWFERHIDVELVISITSVALLLAIWEILARTETINPLFTSFPTEVVSTGWEMLVTGELTPHAVASGRLFVAGLGLAIAVAIPVGVLMGWYSRVSAALDPFVSILYVTPRIALIPLLFIWFGVGLRSQIVIVFLAALFPLLINTIAGVQSVDSSLLRVARSYGARDRDIFRTLALPSAVPFIVSGLRLSMSMALIGVVVAEFFSGNVGIGSLITTAGVSLQTEVVFVGVVIIAAFALGLTALIRRVEARFSSWKTHET